MLCSTPPWTMVTPARSLFSSSLFLHGRGLNDGLANETNDSPDGELEVPGMMRDFLLSRTVLPASSRISAATYSITTAM